MTKPKVEKRREIIDFANDCFCRGIGESRAKELAVTKFINKAPGRKRPRGDVEGTVSTCYAIARDLGPDVYAELFAQLRYMHAADVQYIQTMIDGADNSLEKNEYFKLKHKYLNSMLSLLPKEINVNVQESKSVEDRFKEIFNIEMDDVDVKQLENEND